MLKLSNVTVSYGSFTAIKHVNIEVDKGEIVVLLGANGAGKSTTFRSISGISKLAQGEIHFENSPIGGRAPDKNVQAGIVQCAEGRKLFPQMTVQENLRMGALCASKKKGGNQVILWKMSIIYSLF